MANRQFIVHFIYFFIIYLHYKLYMFVNIIEVSPEMCYWKK